MPVANGNAGKDRHTKLAKALAQHRVDRNAVFAGGAIREVSDQDCGDAIERAGAQKRGEHPIDPVGTLCDVFEQKDGAAGQL